MTDNKKNTQNTVLEFNKPYLNGLEINNIKQAHLNKRLAGDGSFTMSCHRWLEQQFSIQKALLTHSCTAALEMAALLLDIQVGDEVVMPSYTFVSTANAVALRGGVPVFVDVREDTFNLDERLIEDAITAKTKAIFPVHYAGVGCAMDEIMAIADTHGLAVVEDAAQGVMASYKNKPLGSIGDLGTYSFHETKNLIAGEGGALLVNRSDMVQRAEIIREKGTDRSRFFRGEVGKYTWRDIGSSFLPGELIAAFLWAQLEDAESISQRRMASWNYYHDLFSELEKSGVIRRPVIPADCQHNAHMYHLLLTPELDRNQFLQSLNEDGINAVFHYVPLHSSPGGEQFGRAHGTLSVTDDIASRIVRLPLWVGIPTSEQERVLESVKKACGQLQPRATVS